ncbi:MAG: 5'-nucleotidase [Pseudomonadota bacterium]|nr:5'-nucleotidase [Pseudomonadota bacterium]
MSYSLDDRLVIAIASSALFDLDQSDRVFKEEGIEAYEAFQTEHQHVPLSKGVAFPFIRRLLQINKVFADTRPVEVILMSRNSPATGMRVFNSIKNYELDIQRACFLSGKSPFPYLPAFNTSLFLSANQADVQKAIDAGHPAGLVLQTCVEDDPKDMDLRIAFDFDGVIVDDESEIVYKTTGLKSFQQHETDKAHIPHRPGPLRVLFERIAHIQKLEMDRINTEPEYRTILRTAIVTARGAPAHERVVTTLNEWGVFADETFFLGGLNKRPILETLRPHIFFDDQISHLKSAAGTIPSVHIPFGIGARIDQIDPLTEIDEATEAAE